MRIHMHRAATLLAMLATTCVAEHASAADIRYVAGPGDGMAQIDIRGDIEEGDAVKFENTVNSMSEKIAIVVLASSGGLLVEGLEIGTAIHNRKFFTAVDGANCASTCSLIWLAGIERYAGPNAGIGFHAVYVREGDVTNVSSNGNAIVGSYIAQLGFSYRTAAYVTSAQPDKIKWLKWGDRELSGITFTYLPHINSADAGATKNAELNERLNNSEDLVRKEIGAKKVDRLIAWVKAAAAKDPSLLQKLYAQPDPYRWALRQMEESQQQGVSSSPKDAAQAAAALTPAYVEGRRARIEYEGWFAALPASNYRDGASFWAANRSLKPQPACTNAALPAWQAGCNDSRARLAPVEQRRRTEPNFWWGWNSL